jgi:flagellar export protein FliJ
MKAFRFPLQRVLEWRALQMRAQEEKLATLQVKLGEVLHRENALVMTELNAEMNVLRQPAVKGSEFRALASFQVRLRSERLTLQKSRRLLEGQIDEQRKLLIKARKECKTVENLKEKRMQQWSYLHDRELENTAAESYISSWVRSNSGQ